MSLREEMWKYEQITGESAEHVPIIKLGAFLDGYEMGLKALEQQPYEDCISREEAIRATYGFERYTGIDEAPYEYAESVLRDLPPVTPKAEPCDDAISRKDAVDIINGYAEQFNGYIGTPNDTEVYAYARGLLLSIERNISALPSVTPKASEDCISREAIYEALSEWDEQDVYLPYHFKELVAELPSVMPKVEPFSDAISRAEVLRYAQLVRDDEGIVHEMVHVDDIKGASSVTWSGWKSVTWELPEPNTAVLLYVKYKSSGQRTYQLGMWNDSKQSWEDWRTPYKLEEEFEIIAWMELPERYEEDNHE